MEAGLPDWAACRMGLPLGQADKGVPVPSKWEDPWARKVQGAASKLAGVGVAPKLVAP